ncbi:MAG TPA: hypothetical protein VLC98_13705 [Phnomibacter sp.]|nr:hypothetical protein [Phnomibacter sp.]
MNRQLLSIFLLGILFKPATAQQLYCEYKVEHNADMIENGKLLKALTLEYKGHFYFKNNKVLTYLEPLYLKQYPDGQARFETPNGSMTNNLCTKPKQMLSVADFDSLIERFQLDFSPRPGSNGNAECDGELCQTKLVPGSAPWIYLNETKTISGFHCQRAKLYGSQNQLYWDVWFTTEIKVPGSTQGLSDLQGLMVEGLNASNQNKYMLQSYTTNIEIPDNIFWPNCFNGNFEPRRIQKKYTTTMKD